MTVPAGWISVWDCVIYWMLYYLLGNLLRGRKKTCRKCRGSAHLSWIYIQPPKFGGKWITRWVCSTDMACGLESLIKERNVAGHSSPNEQRGLIGRIIGDKWNEWHLQMPDKKRGSRPRLGGRIHHCVLWPLLSFVQQIVIHPQSI